MKNLLVLSICVMLMFSCNISNFEEENSVEKAPSSIYTDEALS
jgi:hypothetical protein